MLLPADPVILQNYSVLHFSLLCLNNIGGFDGFDSCFAADAVAVDCNEGTASNAAFLQYFSVDCVANVVAFPHLISPFALSALLFLTA